MAKCGCKGIRTCLLCEKQKGTSRKKSEEQVASVCTGSYLYCHACDLCWPVGVPVNEGASVRPLRLNGISVMPEFVSEEEEEDAVIKIDSLPWVASQSGRRKQDFGPKVNFKKRKLKAGNFQGFPGFAHKIEERFLNVKVLSGFRSVELCHLEYCPERGSSIDPHVDDSWLWGERLVTLNLLSETVLTLTPSKVDSSADCSSCNFKNITNPGLCQKCLSVHPSNINVNLSSPDDTGPCEAKHYHATENIRSSSNGANNISPSTSTCIHKDNVPNGEFRSHVNDILACPAAGDSAEYCRHDLAKSRTEVRVALPPRSLLVLWSCARHHWCHEIKRKDVTSRRLAMTFRELSNEFLENGTQWSLGEEMLALAQKVIE